jgi:uncharacterized membrane protein
MTRRRRAVASGLVALAGACALAASCGPSGGAPSCPSQTTPVCPDQQPDFATDVMPVLQAVCDNCHAPGGEEASIPFTTYAQITSPRYKTTAFTEVFNCVMPPANAPQPLTDEQRQTLLAWFACGAPEHPPAPDAGAPDGGAPDGGAPDGV